MPILTRLSLRCCALLLVFACLWTLCGAPVLPEQWHQVPQVLRRTVLLLPSRMENVFQLWHTGRLPLTSAQAESLSSDVALKIWHADEQRQFSLPLEQYVLCSLAAEMPAAYPAEALKAQAIAIRTKAIAECRTLGGNGCAAHPECDLCTDASCCQGYLDDAAQETRWGGEYRLYRERIADAVRATTGQIMTYEGLPIQVLYHACSGGMTDDAATVFAQAVPYLTSVASPGEEFFSGYLTDVSYSLTEVCAMLQEAFPECGVTPDGFSGQVRLQSSTASGRIQHILVGQTTVSGRAFRDALKLRSAIITWDISGDTIVFHTRGYGHGVGMSQAGAAAMASQGSRYQAILQYYYPGAELTDLPTVHQNAAESPY